MNDSFADLWASTAPSSTSSRTQKTQSLASQAVDRSQRPIPSNGGGKKYDAFSVLANSGSAYNSQSTSRAATPQISVSSSQTSKGLSAFDDLVSLGPSSKGVKKNSPMSSQLSSTLNSKNSSREWLGAISAGPASQSSSNSNSELWDFDLLNAPNLKVEAPNSRSHSHSPSPDPFDLDAFSSINQTEPTVSLPQDDDDLLGDLSKPVEHVVAQRSTPSPHPSPSPQPKIPQVSSHSPRSSSPPPHVIGRIVEMGFTPEQARIALAATDTGLDVDQALETLLSNTEETPDIEARDLDRSTPPPRQSTRPPIRPNRNVNSSHQATEETSSVAAYQEQADKLISQATVIGLGMLNKANAFWKESKERVQKVYEEHQAQQQTFSRTDARRDSRPRWMADDQLGKGFQEDEPSTKHREKKERSERAQEQRRLAPTVAPEGSAAPRAARVPYQSPLRRGKPSPTPSLQAQSTPNPPPRPPPRALSPPKPHRYVSVHASGIQLSTAFSHKLKGNEAFKLGNYADAEESFNRGITSLPSTHLLLIPLYTNRALARLRNGNPKGCIEDSSAALEIIDNDPRPGETVFTINSEQVKLDESFIKALRRRAEGYEAVEKWDLARSDWEKLAGTNWAPGNQRAEASKGIGRCRKMLNPPSQATPPAKKPPKPSRPQSDLESLNAQPPETVTRLREANNALESEDIARAALKDTVDSKLAAWSAGKESNLRVLLANLDSILWDDLKWKKIGMAELVTENQVKINYTKAIAKVHPDKLANRKVSLENRMIANGVFSILNQAWVSFKP